MTMHIDGIDVSELVKRAERSSAPNPDLADEIDQALGTLQRYTTLESGGRDMLAVLRSQRARLAAEQR